MGKTLALTMQDPWEVANPSEALRAHGLPVRVARSLHRQLLAIRKEGERS